ncbi:hypothetical protein C8233_04430 [Halomonas sp. SF2003]|nr:hypothetical protein C8233_04430 [Halomonas sp. SF2003]
MTISVELLDNAYFVIDREDQASALVIRRGISETLAHRLLHFFWAIEITLWSTGPELLIQPCCAGTIFSDLIQLFQAESMILCHPCFPVRNIEFLQILVTPGITAKNPGFHLIQKPFRPCMFRVGIIHITALVRSCDSDQRGL